MLPHDFHFLEDVYSKYSVPFAKLLTCPLTFFVIPLTELTKSALCEKLGISSRTIAKISKGEDINDNVVGKILVYLDI